MGITFISGVYGVGKSTLGEKISAIINIPFYSAGDLISELNGEIYMENKYVKDKNSNQNILIDAVEKKLQLSKDFILAGHFCIFDKDNKIDLLPMFVFERLDIDRIILLESIKEKILSNISQRDRKTYSTESISNLIKQENIQAKIISDKLNVPLYIHSMKFDSSDIDDVLKFIKEF